MARRFPILVLALALGGAGAWLMLSQSAAPGVNGQRIADSTRPERGGEVIAHLPNRGDRADGRMDAAPSAAVNSAAGPVQAARPELSARVTFRFLRADTADPVCDFLFGLHRLDRARGPLEVPEGPRVGPWTLGSFGIVDGEGRCTFQVPTGAQFSGEERGRPDRPTPFDELVPSVVQFGPLTAGASEEIVVRLHPKRRTSQHFRFVDAITGAAVGDVRLHPMGDRRIRAGVHEVEGGLWTPLTDPVARADAAGMLRLDMDDLDGPAEVFAEGYGPAWIRLRDGGSEAEPRRVPLHGPGRITGSLTGLPMGTGQVEVQLRATHTDLGFNQVSRVGGDDTSAWHLRLPVGPDGDFVAAEIPSSGPVTLDVLFGETVVHSARVTVPPWGLATFEWTWVKRVALTGVLLDGSGKPRPSAQVWVDPTGATLGYTTFKDVRKPLMHVDTGSDGSFRFEGLDPGTYAVGPAKGPGPGYAQVVSVPHPGPLTVQPPAPSTIQGQVLLDGAGVPRVGLRSSEGYFTRTHDDGRFEIQCLGVSPVRVWVHRSWRRGQDQYVGRQSAKAEPGSTGVILELVPEVRRGAVAVDAGSGEPVRAQFVVVLLHASGTIGVRMQLGEHEALRSLRVPSAPTIVWATTEDDRVGRTELLGAMGPGGRTDTQITVAPGGRLRIRAGTRSRIDISDASGPVHAVWVGTNGTELVLPPGNYRLTSGDETRDVNVEVGAATEVPAF